MYMSPEQAESSGLDVDTRTDIYSLGVILFELLVGEPPMAPRGEAIHIFMARLASRRTDPPMPSSRLTTLGTGCEAVAYARHTDPDSLRRQLRGDIDWIVVKALDPDRTRRYESAAALAADIARHLANEPVAARAPSTGYRLRKFVMRHPVAVPVGALAILAIATSASFAVAGLVRARRAEQLAQQEAAAARSVTDFLVGLFAPDETGEVTRSQLTARQLLDRGASRASRELANQPLLRGRILHTVGKAYATLGLYDEARTQLDEALAARTRAHGCDVAARRRDGAGARGRHGVARRSHRCGGPLRPRTGDPRIAARSRASARRARRLWNRRTAGQQGRLDEAEAEYRRALRIDERSAADSAEMAEDLMGLAIVIVAAQALRAGGDADEAKHRRAGAAPRPRQRRSSLAQQPRLALYWSMERYADALPLQERVRRSFERTLDPSHPNIATAYSNLAETYWKLGRFAEAESLFQPRRGDEGEATRPGKSQPGHHASQHGRPAPRRGQAARGGSSVPPCARHPRACARCERTTTCARRARHSPRCSRRVDGCVKRTASPHCTLRAAER